MADKIFASISYIRTGGKKKATIEKVLAHLSKSEICDKAWFTESLKELISDMTAKDQIELVGSGYKIKQNDFDGNCNFVRNTQIENCTSSVPNNLVANLEKLLFLCYPPICQLLLDDQLNRYIMATLKVLFLSKICFERNRNNEKFYKIGREKN